ncbi:MAG TPA: choice-of-anchor L domain-containing protein, partial [Chloroflexia bacterium]|nr:choice-of-anchor L domain-containing protein [Chloroflexia bacterium]
MLRVGVLRFIVVVSVLAQGLLPVAQAQAAPIPAGWAAPPAWAPPRVAAAPASPLAAALARARALSGWPALDPGTGPLDPFAPAGGLLAPLAGAAVDPWAGFAALPAAAPGFAPAAPVSTDAAAGPSAPAPLAPAATRTARPAAPAAARVAPAARTPRPAPPRPRRPDPAARPQTCPRSGLTTQSLSQGLTPQDLATALLGPGVVASNVQYAGAPIAAGTFQHGAGILGFDTGVVLSSGAIANVVGPNCSTRTSAENARGGDADLSNLIAKQRTEDAAVLEFDFVPTAPTLTFQYVFGSEEYNEFVNQYNDTFGLFVNGHDLQHDCAVIGGAPVSVDSINLQTNSALYRNNDVNGTPPPAVPINTELDGLTTVLTCAAAVTPGVPNHMKLAIADALDDALDSDVFLRAGSLRSGGEPCLGLPGTTAGHANPCGYGLDGVNMATGNFAWQAADLVVVAPGLPFAWTRTYNSRDPGIGPFGPGWSVSYGVHLGLPPSAAGPVTVFLEDGAQSVYTAPDSAGHYTRPIGDWAELAVDGAGYRLTRPDETVLHFNAQGQLTALVDRVGRQITIQYGADTWTLTDVIGRTYTAHLQNGLIQDLTANIAPVPAIGRQVRYGYQNGQLTTVTDLRGNVTTYHYDGHGWLDTISTQDALQGAIPRLHTTYNPDNTVQQQQSWGLQAFTVDYGQAADPVLGSPVTRTRARELGQEATRYVYYDHDATFSLRRLTTALTTADQASSIFAYNGDDQLALVQDPLQHATRLDYDGRGNLARVADPVGNAVTYSYVPGTSRVQDVTDNAVVAGPTPVPHTTHYAYFASGDAAGLLQDVRDPLGHHITYDYTTVAVPNGRTVPVLYSVQDARGTTYYHYTDPTRPELRIVGLPVEIDYPPGDWVRLTYDAAGRLTDRAVPYAAHRLPTDPDTVVTHQAYDDGDNLTLAEANYRPGLASTATTNVQTRMAYDALDRPVWTQAPGEWHLNSQAHTAWNPLTGGEVTRIFWDLPTGQPHAVVAGCTQGGIPPIGPTAAADCDAPLAATPALNRKTSYEYDELGRTTYVTDPRHVATQTDYDLAGRPSQITANAIDATHQNALLPQNVRTTLTYYADGRLQDSTDPLNRVTHYAYDPAGRVTDVIQNYVTPPPSPAPADVNLDTHMDYSQPGQQQATDIYTNYQPGVTCPITHDCNIHTQRVYDELNRVKTQIAQYVDGISGPSEFYTDLITNYTYDAVGNLQATAQVGAYQGPQDATPQDLITVTAYDPLHRPIQIIQNCRNAQNAPDTDPTHCVGQDNTTNDKNIRTNLSYTTRGDLQLIDNPETQTTNQTTYPVTASMQRLQTYNWYDPLGRLDRQVDNYGGTAPPSNVNTDFQYTPGGQVTAVTRYLAARPVTQYSEYNTAGWLIGQRDPTDRRVELSYNALGHAIVQADLGIAPLPGSPHKRETRIAYDALERPDQAIVNYQTGASPAPDADLVTTLTYDNGNRILERAVPGGAQGARHTRYGYDGLDRLTQVTELPADTVGTGVIRSSFDPQLQTQHDYALTTQYRYDRRGLLTRVCDPRAASCDSATGDYAQIRTYNEAGGLQTEYFAGPSQNPEINYRAYTYDKRGNRTSVADDRPALATSRFDALDRLVAVDAHPGTQARAGAPPQTGPATAPPPAPVQVALKYDPAGHRIQLGDVTGETDYVYDGLARPAQVGAPAGGYTFYQYDTLGRRSDLWTSDLTVPHLQYGYDDAGRLETIYRADGTSHPPTYAHADYDNLGRIFQLAVYPVAPAGSAGDHPAAPDPPGPAALLAGYQFDLADRLVQKTTELATGGNSAAPVLKIGFFKYDLYKDGRLQH